MLLSLRERQDQRGPLGALSWTLYDCLPLFCFRHAHGGQTTDPLVFSQRSMQSPEIESFPPKLKHSLSFDSVFLQVQDSCKLCLCMCVICKKQRSWEHMQITTAFLTTSLLVPFSLSPWIHTICIFFVFCRIWENWTLTDFKYFVFS